MPTVLLDTDFLSSFLKIHRCDLIRALYRVEQAFIPAAVHRELAQTDLLRQLLEVPWISVWPEEPPSDEGLLQDPGFQALGTGEQACILLARSVADAVLLTSDNLARPSPRESRLSASRLSSSHAKRWLWSSRRQRPGSLMT